MKYEDFKELFEQKFFSMKDNHIIKWNVEKVILCNYHRDENDVLYPIYDGNLDIEYRLVRKDINNYKVAINIHRNIIGKTFFSSIAELIEHITPQ